MRELNRGELLRLSAAGALATAAGTLAAVPARGAAPAPAPQGEDIGFVQWGATAELVAVIFWDRALAADRFGAETRSWFKAMRAADVQHLVDLSAILGDEAPTTDDFEVVFPRGTFGSRTGIVAAAADIEESITRTYLAAVTQTTDPATRLLLGKLLAQDVGHLDAIRSLDGRSSAFAGRRGPLGLEQAGQWLDRHLRVRSS